MKLFKKLNSRGIAHHLVLAVIVLVVAVGGTYYLVASHADTCGGTTTSPTTSPVTDPVAKPFAGKTATTAPVTAPGGCATSAPTTSPVTSPGGPIACTAALGRQCPTPTPTPTPTSTTSFSCTITGVPSVPAVNQVINASVLISNLSGASGSPVASETLPSGSHVTLHLPKIGAHQTYRLALPSYKVVQSAAGGYKSYTVTGTSPVFSCSASFQMPLPPTYLGDCTLNAPASVKVGSSISVTAIVHNTGTGAYALKLPASIVLNGGAHGSLKTYSSSKFQPGSTITVSLGKYTVSKTSKATAGTITAHSTSKAAFGCSQTFAITKH